MSQMLQMSQMSQINFTNVTCHKCYKFHQCHNQHFKHFCNIFTANQPHKHFCKYLKPINISNIQCFHFVKKFGRFYFIIHVGMFRGIPINCIAVENSQYNYFVCYFFIRSHVLRCIYSLSSWCLLFFILSCQRIPLAIKTVYYCPTLFEFNYHIGYFLCSNSGLLLYAIPFLIRDSCSSVIFSPQGFYYHDNPLIISLTFYDFCLLLSC